MKKSLFTAVAAGALTCAVAAGASAASAENYQIKEEGASAHFSSLDPKGCIATDTFVWLGESVTKQGPGAPVSRAEVFASYSKLNICDWTYLIAAYGSTSSATLAVDRTRSASLSGTIPLYDDVSGTTIDLAVDLTWTGVGEAMHGHSTINDHFGGMIFRYRSNGWFRDAEVSGSIRTSLDPKMDLTPSAAGYGQLYNSRSGSMVIIKGDSQLPVVLPRPR